MSTFQLLTYTIGSGLLLLGLSNFAQSKMIPVKKKAVRHVNNNR